VARGTQHRKNSARPNARVAPAQPKAKPKGKPDHAKWEDQLFFSRLRLHAKPVFIFLAVVFMLSFVLLGVGSGSSGIGDVFQNWFQGSSSSSTSVSALEKKVAKEPKNAAAWRNLATAYAQKDETDKAVAALVRFTTLKPKDETGLQQLASLYLTQADTAARKYVAAKAKADLLAPSQTFKPSSSSPLAQAFQDPLSTAITQLSTADTTAAYAAYIGAQEKAVGVYKKLVAVNPTDATNQYRLAQIAQSAGDSTTAIAAYKKFLVLAPTDTLAPSARKQLKQLQAAAATAPVTATATTG
jgi:tetratricopeptide (TPR) repeat protein